MINGSKRVFEFRWDVETPISTREKLGMWMELQHTHTRGEIKEKENLFGGGRESKSLRTSPNRTALISRIT